MLSIHDTKMKQTLKKLNNNLTEAKNLRKITDNT